MPNLNNENDFSRVNILMSIAAFLYHEARGLLIGGTGHDHLGNEITNVVPEIDTIPADTDGYRWANAVSRFLGYLATILSTALQENAQLETQANLQALMNYVDENDPPTGEI